jgi:cation diffusion facilitator family transporter
VTTDRHIIENRVVNGGLTANAVLAALKTFFGIVGHSEALLADGINSTSDVVYGIVVKIFLALSHKPPDREHPFGHRQLESIAALIVGSFVVVTAIALFWDAVNTLYDLVMARERPLRVGIAALWVALVTIAVKLALAYQARRVALRSGNLAILALARDHANDILSASGAAAGILASRLGFPWADPLMGAIVALVVFYTGLQIIRESASDLTDAVPGEILDRQARDLLRDLPGLVSVEEVLAHRFGPYIVLYITVSVDGAIPVSEGHRIASQIEHALGKGIALVRRVYVHYQPARLPRGQAKGDRREP